MSYVVLTVIGSDQPGLTEALAGAVLSTGGNWLESHLSRLGGLYVGSVLVDVDEGKLGVLRSTVLALDVQGLEVRIAAALEATGEAGPTGDALQFGLVGRDRPGIVRQVTAILKGLDVNIETFASWITEEPHSGAPLFHVDARLRLRAGAAPTDVQAALEDISAEVMVDVSVPPMQ